MHSKKKKVGKRKRKKAPHPEHTTKAAAARRTRPPRDDARKNVPHVRPHSSVSIDAGFVEIGLVQLSQSVKTSYSMSHTHTHIPTDNLNTGTMYAPRYDDTFWPKGKRCPVSSLPRPFFITSRAVNEARRPHTCCRPCAFEEQKSNKTKTIKNTHCPKHNTISTAAWRPQPPRDGARRDTFYALAHIPPLP